jgi:hypothetical protein
MTQPPPPPVPAGGPAKPAVIANPTIGLASTLGGLALVIGAFLEAATGPETATAFLNTNYIDGDGPIMLVLGAAIIALGFFIGRAALPRFNALFVAGAGILAALVAVVDINDVQDSPFRVDPGPALYVCLVGGIAAAVLGIIAFVAKRVVTDDS